MKKTLKAFFPIAEGIQRLLYPHAEVVIHDINKNKIVAIFHPFSKRKVGDSSLLTESEMQAVEDCMGPYEKLNWDGRKLKSVSSVIRDEQGKAVGMLCINLDVSKLEKMNRFFSEFMQFAKITDQSHALFKDDWQEKINHYVHRYLNKYHLSLESLDREEKKALIEHLHKVGAFTGKNAALYIAQILGVSRATIYNYLEKENV
ncbi:hypothetical protein AYO45_06630 [Gammaproteobacteria bacterium SCGC AG-212-F23]|nr:hypothetical protein AYO45_06630 [Gammaproteobacteria bacterium SCGC AG-212-F23]